MGQGRGLPGANRHRHRAARRTQDGKRAGTSLIGRPRAWTTSGLCLLGVWECPIAGVCNCLNTAFCTRSDVQVAWSVRPEAPSPNRPPDENRSPRVRAHPQDARTRGFPHYDPALVPSPQGKYTSVRVRAGHGLAAGAGEIATEGQAAGKRTGRRRVVKTAGRAPVATRATVVKQKPAHPTKDTRPAQDRRTRAPQQASQLHGKGDCSAGRQHSRTASHSSGNHARHAAAHTTRHSPGARCCAERFPVTNSRHGHRFSRASAVPPGRHCRCHPPDDSARSGIHRPTH